MKTLEEKREIAKGIDGDTLLTLYDNCCRNFDPFNDDACETYNVIRSEILKRLQIGNKN